jgi:hypothetical protein
MAPASASNTANSQSDIDGIEFTGVGVGVGVGNRKTRCKVDSFYMP